MYCLMSMKKLFTVMTLLLPLAVMAQHWNGPSQYKYSDETPVHVQVYINGVLANANSGLELAAFIDQECRATQSQTTLVAANPEDPGTERYILRVWGDGEEDLNKPISFRAFYQNIEYAFTTTTDFTGNATALTLNLDAVTGVTLPERIPINQPATAFPYSEDLSRYITWNYKTPEGTDYTPLGESSVLSPVEYSWNVGNYANDLSFDGKVVTINNAVSMDYDVNLYAYFGDRTQGEYQSFVRIPTIISVDIKAIPVTAIACDINKLDFWAFDDFEQYMASHITITPAEASNKSYYFVCDGLSDGKFIQGGQYTVQIYPEDREYTGQPATVDVTVYVRPSDISPKSQSIEVFYGDNVYAAIAENQNTLWPTDGDPGQYGKSEVTYRAGEEGFIDQDGKAIQLGTVRVTVRLDNGITPSETFVGNASYTVSVTIKTALSVTARPTDVINYVKKGNQVSTQSPALVYVSNPAGEAFDPNDLAIRFSYRNGDETQPYAVQRSLEQEAGDAQTIYSFHIQPIFIGDASYDVTWKGEVLYSGRIIISKEEDLSAGWNWVSLCTFGGPVADLFTQSDIVEIRSQEALLWNDPQYGYVGDIIELSPYSGMYKIRTAKTATVNWGSESPMLKGYDTSIYQGYNWVNYPYEFDLPLSRLSELFGNQFEPADGDRIITRSDKSDFAIYDAQRGAWTGDASFSLKEGKGLLYYSTAEGDPKWLFFDSHLAPQINYFENAGQGNVKSFNTARNVADELLQYDVHAFADNMSMVAEVEGLDNPEDYTLGAFVGNECRGRGRVAVDGKMFVSAVGTSGETVTFKLVNNSTGEMTPVDGTVRFGLIRGSLRAPVMLAAPAATGITKVSTQPTSAQTYDLSGRRIAGSQRGISIERMANGNFRKVVKK